MTLENFNYRTNPLFLRNQFISSNSYGIPEIPKSEFCDDYFKDLKLLAFNSAKSDNGKHCERFVHFFLYDYNFESVWKNPEKIIEVLSKYKGVLTPDFSMYTEMPYAVQIYNTFRNRWCGAYFASKGIKVVPTVNWSDEGSFDFCFKGIPKGSVVAVSTYMFHESAHHADQKELFLAGYNRMLSEIEPEKIICYSEPFDEMQGDIIYVDYELSSWKHLSDEKSVVYGLPNNKKSDIIVKSYGYVCKGGGSAFGGGWKPKSTADERLVGEPGEIKTSFLGGYSRETLIGDNGYAIKERHYTTAPNPKYHTNPHDHTITWENNYPCFGEAENYWSGDVPALKYHIKIGDSFNMTNHFESLSEIKFSILYGGELIFRNNNRTYGITRLNKERIVLAEINGKNEVSFESLDKLLEFEIDGRKMSDILKTAEIIDRNI